MKLDFEWAVEAHESVSYVHERLVGSEHENLFGPMPHYAVDSFVRARRDYVARTMRNAGALKLIMPHVTLQ